MNLRKSTWLLAIASALPVISVSNILILFPETTLSAISLDGAMPPRPPHPIALDGAMPPRPPHPIALDGAMPPRPPHPGALDGAIATRLS
jgi:hypothetical protein